MARKVRAKVECIGITQRKDSWDAEFQFSYKDKSPENDEFFKYTPSGTVKVNSTKAGLFEVGCWYYLDFIPTTLEGTDA